MSAITIIGGGDTGMHQGSTTDPEPTRGVVVAAGREYSGIVTPGPSGVTIRTDDGIRWTFPPGKIDAVGLVDPPGKVDAVGLVDDGADESGWGQTPTPKPPGARP